MRRFFGAPLPLLLFLVPLVALLAFAACDGDDGDGDGDGGDGGGVAAILPEGEYPLQVSGTLQFSVPEESVSAVAFGPVSQTAELSGSATLNMGVGGSFEIAEWGISGTFSEGGQSQTIEMRDSSAEPTTGATTADGATADVYVEMTLSGSTTGANTDTVAMSGDPFLDAPTTASLDMTNAPVDVVDGAGAPILTINAWTIDITYDPDATTVPDQDGDGVDGDGVDGDGVDGDGVDGDGPPFVLVQETVGCQHTQPGVESEIQKLVQVLLLGGSQNRHQDPAQPDLLVLVTDEGSLPAIRQDPVLGQGTPLEGATVNVNAVGSGVVPGEETQQEVTDVNGQARATFRITAFGPYRLTVGSVAASDGTLYQFDPDSQLTEMFDVPQTCESPEGW